MTIQNPDDLSDEDTVQEGPAEATGDEDKDYLESEGMPGDISEAYDNLKKDIQNTFIERDAFETQLEQRTHDLVKELEDVLNDDGYICDKSVEEQMKLIIKKYLLK